MVKSKIFFQIYSYLVVILRLALLAANVQLKSVG